MYIIQESYLSNPIKRKPNHTAFWYIRFNQESYLGNPIKRKPNHIAFWYIWFNVKACIKVDMNTNYHDQARKRTAQRTTRLTLLIPTQKTSYQSVDNSFWLKLKMALDLHSPYFALLFHFSRFFPLWPAKLRKDKMNINVLVGYQNDKYKLQVLLPLLYSKENSKIKVTNETKLVFLAMYSFNNMHLMMLAHGVISGLTLLCLCQSQCTGSFACLG